MRQEPLRVSGPLGPYVESFRAALVAQGYKPLGVVGQVRFVAHVSRWLAASGLEPGDLTEDRIEEFLKCRRATGYTQWLSPLATVPLMGHLRRLGVAPAPPPAPTTAVEDLVADYRDYLVGERGLAPATVASYLHVARLFLSERSDHPGFGLNRLSAGEVTDFVLGECRGRSVGSTASVVCGLRALLRFVYVDGLTPTDLAGAVPNAPSWRLTWLPRSVDATTVSRLLKSCDRRTTIGRRDYAILTLLVRLGLRRGEVAALNLADIDWRAGEIVIRGKGRREERLPLPVDVGEAVAGWLRRGRPRVESARVFLRVRAPLGAMSPVGVSHVVHSASQRAGVAPVTAHQLRHTAATQMLRAGADLTEIGQVLRHRSQLSTAIYAKVDLGGLRSVAQCWPGGAA